MTFMDKSLTGEVLDIEQFIADWHEGRAGAGMELHAYLGMTWEEYRQWLEAPATLPALLDARKTLACRAN
ncbi:hypothetical protein [Pseudomonas fragariae (ex Marin et al. 2024)]|uniref:hypothetical protein n=1 Tax=Pseudomonas fragariae (ex Marin et al. 2024) TaxID=3080056 RepID=UPI002A24BAE9|nr:hypothetical protein [Pseudomonas sp. 20]MDX9625921.1 hypothetical protein [Pseudomonas sp. 20]